MSLVLYIFSVYLTHIAAEQLAMSPERAENNHKLKENFGGVRVACYSLWQAVSGGMDWALIAHPLVMIDPHFGYLFSLYVAFMLFVMMNVITSVFLHKAVQHAFHDYDLVINDEITKDNSYLSDMRVLFLEADSDRDGMLTWQEFEKHLHDPRVHGFFKAMELDAAEAKELFTLLDKNEDGYLTADEFLTGCLQLKGGATTVDMRMLLRENKKMTVQWQAFMRFCADQFDRGFDLETQTLAAIHALPKSSWPADTAHDRMQGI